MEKKAEPRQEEMKPAKASEGEEKPATPFKESKEDQVMTAADLIKEVEKKETGKKELEIQEKESMKP